MILRLWHVASMFVMWGGIYDPSKKKFDHHQTSYTGPLSSAGMVWKYFQDTGIINPAMYRYLNGILIQGIDAHDNGVVEIESGFFSFSQVVSNFLPIEGNACPKAFQETFLSAFDFVYYQLQQLQKKYLYTQSCKEKVKQCMEKSKLALVFDESIPWMDNFFELGGEGHPALYVVMPTGIHWKVRGIPPSVRDKMRVRRPLPEEWAGLHEKELQKKTGIAGAIFCHKGRFISIWQTREDAMKALAVLLSKEEE